MDILMITNYQNGSLQWLWQAEWTDPTEVQCEGQKRTHNLKSERGFFLRPQEGSFASGCCRDIMLRLEVRTGLPSLGSTELCNNLKHFLLIFSFFFFMAFSQCSSSDFQMGAIRKEEVGLRPQILVLDSLFPCASAGIQEWFLVILAVCLFIRNRVK